MVGKIFLGVFMQVSLEEISIWIGRLNKENHHHQCKWRSSNPLRTRIEQKCRGRASSLSELRHPSSPALSIEPPDSQVFKLGGSLSWWLRQWRICLQCGRPWFNLWVSKIPWKGMAKHSSILAWSIPWTEELGGLQFMGLQSWTCLSDYTLH